MKKIVSVFLAAFILLALCSCGGKDKTVSDPSSKASSEQSDIAVSDYSPDETSSEQVTGDTKAVTRYFLYGSGKVLKTTFDVDYSVEGTITVNLFDKNNYKTGIHVYEYDENGLVTYFSVRDKDGNEKNYTTYEYNNLMKVNAEYYYEADALRTTTTYFYDANGNITEKTVENVGETEVYKWEYAREDGALFAIYISTDIRQNFEGYNFANNPDGKLHQKYHILNGAAADYYLYDYDGDGDMNYKGHFDKSNSLTEYYEFKYGKTTELAAKAFKNTGILS